MSKAIRKTGEIPAEAETDSSEYIFDGDSTQLDLGGLLSREFTNIRPLYSSHHGPTEIYIATRYGRRFVLKGLREQYRNDPTFTVGLVKEFEIGMQLDHPNIRRTLGMETVEDIGKVIVLEYVDGCSLESLIASGNLKETAARRIIEQIASALGYLHGKQIFHRDIKPSNILISHQGSMVKLIDFNLSDSGEFIVLKNPAGTRKYMAPEQLAPGAVPTAAADIFSLGVVMDEVAAAVGDEQMAAAAARCRRVDPARRPKTVAHIGCPHSNPSVLQSLSDFLSSKILTYILICVCLILLVYIIWILLR